MEVLLTLVYTVLFSVIIYKSRFFKLDTLTRLQLTMFFWIKIAAGVCLYLIYAYYYDDRYNSDIFKYFDDSKVMYDALWSKPVDYLKMLFGINNDSPYFDKNYYHVMNNWYRVYESNLYNDSHTIIRFNALVRLFSFGYYNVHTVFICFLSFTGLTAIYKTFVNVVKGKEKLLVFAIFLIPSVIFWGSGVLKEGILLFGMGLLIYNLHKILNRNYSFYVFIAVIFSMVLLFYTKFYIISILLPLLIAFGWVYKTKHFLYLKYGAILFSFGILALNLHHVFPEFNILEILTRKQHDFFGLAKEFEAGSTISLPSLEPNISGFLYVLPKALFNTFFRPHFFDVSNPFILLSLLENILMFGFAVVAIVFSSFKEEKMNVFVFSLLFVLLTYALIGITTPVLGAIVRYKVPALPFYFLIFILILDKEKLINRFPKFSKLL